jgi:hypothetical protein
MTSLLYGLDRITHISGTTGGCTAPLATRRQPSLRRSTITNARPTRPPDSKPPSLHKTQGDSLSTLARIVITASDYASHADAAVAFRRYVPQAQ